MIKQFDEFINEANNKTEENAWREMVLVTDNVREIYSMINSFTAELVTRGEKKNIRLHDDILKNKSYNKELHKILDKMKEYDDKQSKKYGNSGLTSFLSMDENDQLYMLAHRVCDEVEDYDTDDDFEENDD